MGIAAGTAALIGGGIAAAGAVGAAVIGSGATSKAAAATTQAADTAAGAVTRNYDLSAAALQPWQQSGLAANQTINSFLGLTPTQPAAQPQQTNALAQYGGQQGGFASMMAGGFGFDPSQFGVDPSNYAVNGTPYLSQQTGIAQQVQPVNAADGFKQYIANSDYGFQFGQGANKVNSGYAGAGTLQSGAAMKALEGYRQNLQQGYRGEYIGALGNQQSLGLTAAQAQAGVGGNAANSLANIYQNKGDNLANAALASGQNSANLVNSLATIGSGIFGKSGGGAVGGSNGGYRTY